MLILLLQPSLDWLTRLSEPRSLVDLNAGAKKSRRVDLDARAEKSRCVDLATGADTSRQVDLAAGAYKP